MVHGLMVSDKAIDFICMHACLYILNAILSTRTSAAHMTRIEKEVLEILLFKC